MKTTRNLVFAITALFSMSAMADREIIYDYGTVVEAVPIVKNIRVSTPREECWEEEVVYRDSGQKSGVSTVVGALVGGAIGNALGHHKKNKQVGAVLGAVLGGTIGHSIGNKNRGQTVSRGTEEVCKVYNDYHEEERIMGYHVRYRFNNETFSTRTNTHPGDTIKLRLAISPVQS